MSGGLHFREGIDLLNGFRPVEELSRRVLGSTLQPLIGREADLVGAQFSEQP